jgi:hypothetical protein
MPSLVDAWCIVTESEAGQERWLVTLSVTEGERDAYRLPVSDGRSGIGRLGYTNWDGGSAGKTLG